MTIDHRPLAYELGPLMITGFGLAVLAAFVVAQIVAQHELKRRGYSPEPVGDMIFAAVVGSLLGAKLYFVVLTGDIDTLFSRGGFVFWGGLIGGILAVTILVLKRKLGFWRIADVVGYGQRRDAGGACLDFPGQSPEPFGLHLGIPEDAPRLNELSRSVGFDDLPIDCDVRRAHRPHGLAREPLLAPPGRRSNSARPP